MEEDKKKQSRPNGQQDESAHGKERKKALIDIIKQADGIKNKLKELLDKL